MANRIPENLLRQATLLDRGVEPRHLDDARELAALLRPEWQARSCEIDDGPVASRQYFRELTEPVMVASQTAITGTSEAALWPTVFSTFAANSLRPGQMLQVTAFGIITTPSATPGTMTVTPRFGTTVSGTSLGGAGPSGTLNTSLTNTPWYLDFLMTVRSVGTSATVVGVGRIVTLALPSSPGNLSFGGTVATVDTTAAAGIWLGITLSVGTSPTMTTQGLAVEVLN
jgi:hypothetical protein